MIYLDNGATTRTLDAAVRIVQEHMSVSYFNPSSAYSPAVEVERKIKGARGRLAKALSVMPDEIIYTSGGTESNNMAIDGTLKAMRGRGQLIVGATEHPSVFEKIKRLESEGYNITIAPVDGGGAIDVRRLGELLAIDTRLVCIMHVNNEVGAINDIAAISSQMRKLSPDALLHVDGVQGFLKIPFDARYCDMYTISGHKFHAPKGVGALYVRNSIRFAGGQIGGGQENNMRSGTSNVPGIMGMDTAIDYYLTNQNAAIANMRACKRRLANNLMTFSDVTINGPKLDDGTPHILNVSFYGVKGEVLLHALEEREIYVSTGSACSAHKKGKTRILNAMGITGARQDGAIRFSLCPFNTLNEMDRVASVIGDLLPGLRRYTRR